MNKILVVFFSMLYFCTFSQVEKCDSIFSIENLEVEAKLGNKENPIYFFNNEILPLIYDTLNAEPPTSFKSILIVNNLGRVVSIKNIKDYYSKETLEKLLEQFQKLRFSPARKNNVEVCSEYYFVINCILYH